MDKGNVNKHRVKLEGLGRVVEEQKWGRDKAIERYGKLDQPNMKPVDRSEPQRLGDANNLRGPGWQDDVAKDWRRGYGMPPNFDPYKGRKK